MALTPLSSSNPRVHCIRARIFGSCSTFKVSPPAFVDCCPFHTTTGHSHTALIYCHGFSGCYLCRDDRGHEKSRQAEILWQDAIPAPRLRFIADCVSTIDSDSDSSIEQLTNRGNKLRRRARFVHEGQLAPPTGPQVYKRVCRGCTSHIHVVFSALLMIYKAD